jgi:hypothetical protein
MGQSSDYRVDQSELSVVEEKRPIRPYIRTKRLLDGRADSEDIGSPGGEAGAGDLPFLPYKTQPVAQFDPFQQPIQSQRQMKELNYDGEKFYYRVVSKNTSRRFTAGQEVQRVHFESNERVEVQQRYTAESALSNITPNASTISEKPALCTFKDVRVEDKENQSPALRPSVGGTSDKLYAFLYNQIRRPVINQLLWQGRTLDFANESVFH